MPKKQGVTKHKMEKQNENRNSGTTIEDTETEALSDKGLRQKYLTY